MRLLPVLPLGALLVFQVAHFEGFPDAELAHDGFGFGGAEIDPRRRDQRGVIGMKVRKFAAVAGRQNNIAVAGADASFLGRRRAF